MSTNPDHAATWNAAEYHKSSAAQQGWARQLIDKLGLQGHERVLDIGCGDGKVTAEIARRLSTGTVVGIDHSADMIHFATASFPATAFPNLSFRLMDASAMTFHEEFDIVFSNAALHWVINHWPVLAVIARALVPGGRMLVQMGGKGNAATVMAAVQQVMQRERWRPYFIDFTSPYGFYGPEEYRGWLIEAGLQPLRVELIPKDMAQHGRDGLAGWFRTTWHPFTYRLPEALREAFIAEVLDLYLATSPPDNEGIVHVPMVRLEVEAIKK